MGWFREVGGYRGDRLVVSCSNEAGQDTYLYIVYYICISGSSRSQRSN